MYIFEKAFGQICTEQCHSEITPLKNFISTNVQVLSIDASLILLIDGVAKVPQFFLTQGRNIA